jgi:LacI family transcriptional regulator
MTELSTWLKSLPKPVAIMACDDNQAFLVVEVCRHLAINENITKLRIPDDVAILGVDNDESICCLSHPNLSSINQEVEKGGYELARYIDDLLKNPDKPKKDIIVPVGNIMSRQSSDIFVNDDPSIAKVLRYIHENIATKMSVNDIVSEVPLSRRLLESRFKKEMGTSIYDYIIRIRIEKIAELLSEGKAVSEAAFELGLTDIKNVSRSFKKLMGCTPSEYRENRFSPQNGEL